MHPYVPHAVAFLWQCQSTKPLSDDKGKFRQWNVKLTNTLTHLNKGYGWAIERINECLDKGGDPGEAS